jgi:cysteinyl-tRNA synthetase
MALQIYDTMTRKKQDFVPADPSRVTMYVCGPTVYGHVHIGNARPVVVFDVLFRLLRHIYGEAAVVYARNITDVDDKINAAAAKEGVDIKVITDRYAADYEEQMAALGALAPTFAPRATDHIQQMLNLIGALTQRGCAYAAEGHVLFDTTSFEGYGQLSGRDLDDMIAGARVEVAPYKKNPADFVLWKPSKPGEPAWESRWGPGRPGWHLECSAMIETVLGQLPIDIHGGGVDLVFPHHENERAQSLCAHADEDGKPKTELARYWMHNGFLDFGGEKMSKSLGNVIRPVELLKHYPGEALRWALLSAHYRQPLDWDERLIEQSRKSLDYLYGVLRRAEHGAEGEIPTSLIAALSDDLNTPKAQAELHALAKQVETGKAPAAALVAAGALLGFLQADPDAWFEGGADDDLKAKVDAMLAERLAARQAKDFAAADRIREELDAMGVVVMDGPEGATWRLRD